MKLSHIAIGLAAAATPLAAMRVPSGHVALEKRSVHTKRWVKRDRVVPDAKFYMRIGLAQGGMENAEDMILDVSHPDSPNYGKHWTKDEVIKAFQPSEHTVQSVRAWLNEAGIHDSRIERSENLAWFKLHVTAEEAEALLHTKYHEFEDVSSGGLTVACDQYHVPHHIAEHIDYITPGIQLDRIKFSDGKIERVGGISRREIQREKERLAKRANAAAVGNHKPKRRLPLGRVEVLKNGAAPPAGNNSNPNDLKQCDVNLVPACIKTLYNITEPAPSNPNPNNTMGIYESELQFWNQPDLNQFFKKYTPWIPQGTHPIDKNIDGGQARNSNRSAAGGESMLDFDMAYPIVYPQTITTFNEDDLHYQSWANQTYTWGFNDMLDAFDGSYCTYSAFGETGNSPIDPVYPDPGPGGYNGTTQCGGLTPTNVISVSYGGQEADVPIAYQKRQCNEFMKLGLQGVSFLFASGDAGVGNDPPAYGGDDGPTGCLGPQGNIFNPTWPNTCPFVTNVGATRIYPGYTVYDPESAVWDPAGAPYATNYSSGGGFSNVYPIPQYQAKAVATYFQDHNPPHPSYSKLANATGDVHDILTHPNVTQLSAGTNGVYNKIGRGYPDVSANGDQAAIVLDGQFTNEGGTSQSTPIFASVINRINEERLAKGKSVLGFLNPSLYNNPAMFNDITNGTNVGCGVLGFQAVEGWDPVTGLGTPNYPKMLEYYLSLK